MSKHLLSRFGSLSGVFSASVSELCEVSGVGRATAEYIKRIGESLSLVQSGQNKEHSFTNYDALGEYLTSLFSSEKAEIYLLLFDGGMRLISKHKLYECDFSSAAVRAEAFIAPAVRCGAAAAVIAHNHPYGPLLASEGDMATNVAVREALMRVQIPLLEHYLISGSRYVGFSDSIPSIFDLSSQFFTFIESKGGFCRE